MKDCPKCGDGSACGRVVSQPDCPMEIRTGQRVRWGAGRTGTVQEGGTASVLVRPDVGYGSTGWIHNDQVEVIR